MKKLYIIALVTIIFSSCQVLANNIQTYKFITLGNCYSCKLRIEAIVNTLAGIDSVYWSEETHITTVTFDTTKTDLHKIMKIITTKGHDTEWYRGDDFVYNYQLIGTCCEYKRTIDYSQVKVGYLSLMDKWVGVDTSANTITNLYYKNNQLYYTLEQNYVSGSILRIFDLSGNEIVQKDNLSTSSSIDLSYLATGAYIVIFERNNKTIFKTKFIK